MVRQLCFDRQLGSRVFTHCIAIVTPATTKAIKKFLRVSLWFSGSIFWHVGTPHAPQRFPCRVWQIYFSKIPWWMLKKNTSNYEHFFDNIPSCWVPEFATWWMLKKTLRTMNSFLTIYQVVEFQSLQQRAFHHPGSSSDHQISQVAQRSSRRWIGRGFGLGFLLLWSRWILSKDVK